MATGVSLFLLPNQLSSGGVSGIATITYYLFNIPVGTMILIINVPLFLFAFFKIGKSFFVKSSNSIAFFVLPKANNISLNTKTFINSQRVANLEETFKGINENEYKEKSKKEHTFYCGCGYYMSARGLVDDSAKLRVCGTDR